MPAVGAACKVDGNVCSPGTCNAQAGCDAKEFAAAGTSCGPMVGCSTPICDGKGVCVAALASVGTPCSGTSPITCSKHTCNAAGQCVVGPATGEVCNSSKKGAPYCFLEATPECKQPVCTASFGHFSLEPTPGKACKATSACTAGVCDASGECTQVPGNEGLKCPLSASASAQCALGVCSAGSCTIVAKPGAACGNDPCKVGTCDAKGACVQVATPGKVCGPEGPCTAKICSAAGTCDEVATPGKSCPGKSTCFAGVCDAAKVCTQVPKPGASCQTIGLCGNGVCNSTGGCVDPAWPDPPACMTEQAGVFSECWTGVNDGSGGCKKVAKVGASCGCWVSPCSIGTCQADGSCLQKPSKPVGSACSSACVATGTCSEAGLCVGKVADGATCTPYADSDTTPVQFDCASYACQADGRCAASPKLAGSKCEPGYAYVSKPGMAACNYSNSCDGKGRCVALSGTSGGGFCPSADPCAAATECVAGQCLTKGQVADGTPCAMGCFSGTCTAGACGLPGDLHSEKCILDEDCATSDCCGPFGLPQLTGSIGMCSTAPTGKCWHFSKSIYCGSNDSECIIGVCGADLKCYFKNAALGTDCGIGGPCDDHFCHNGTCVNGADPGYNDWDCDDGNPCTWEQAIDKCSCKFTGEYTEGWSCAPGAHCAKGNCVPD
jgi:hypothetical protein